jgi:hypothetical protein
MGTCKTRQIDINSKYYFNNYDENILRGGEGAAPTNINNAAMEQRVSLHISIKNVDSLNEHKVHLKIYTGNTRDFSKSMGFTENKAKDTTNNTIAFQQFFTIPYYFEKQQLMDFYVYNNAFSDSYEKIETSLGSILGSRAQTLKKKLNDGSDIYITGKEIKKSNSLINFDVGVNGFLLGMGLRYSITNLGTSLNPSSTKLYLSELKNVNKNSFNKNIVNFNRCNIPVMFLSPTGKLDEYTISVQLEDMIHNQVLGQFKSPIPNFLGKDKINVNLTQNLKLNISCSLEKHPTFISYLRSDMNINLTIGIDFTGSNGHYKDEPSYHYLDAGMNNYEKAIRSCGDILAPYDNDQLFPVFAFGFCFIDSSLNQFDGQYTDFNYPINCNVENPEINTIDGVLKEYRNFITKIHLSGPTYFAPMINDLNNVCKKELNDGLIMNYHIIMILTDGQIDDMNETKDALVEASFLPVSVIIIGIGNGNFGNMDILDADDNPLYDRNGRKADRDLVQFVPFNKFKDNPQKLAEEVLEEIPRQVVEYYQHKHIEPKEDEDFVIPGKVNNNIDYDINEL